jgi:hypothetical protein
MRTTAMQIAASILVTACPQLGHIGSAGAEPALDPTGDRMGEVVAAVRAEEEKYRDIEYTIRLTTR